MNMCLVLLTTLHLVLLTLTPANGDVISDLADLEADLSARVPGADAEWRPRWKGLASLVRQTKERLGNDESILGADLEKLSNLVTEVRATFPRHEPDSESLTVDYGNLKGFFGTASEIGLALASVYPNPATVAVSAIVSIGLTFVAADIFGSDQQSELEGVISKALTLQDDRGLIKDVAGAAGLIRIGVDRLLLYLKLYEENGRVYGPALRDRLFSDLETNVGLSDLEKLRSVINGDRERNTDLETVTSLVSLCDVYAQLSELRNTYLNIALAVGFYSGADNLTIAEFQHEINVLKNDGQELFSFLITPKKEEIYTAMGFWSGYFPFLNAFLAEFNLDSTAANTELAAMEQLYIAEGGNGKRRTSSCFNFAKNDEEAIVKNIACHQGEQKIIHPSFIDGCKCFDYANGPSGALTGPFSTIRFKVVPVKEPADAVYIMTQSQEGLSKKMALGDAQLVYVDGSATGNATEFRFIKTADGQYAFANVKKPAQPIFMHSFSEINYLGGNAAPVSQNYEKSGNIFFDIIGTTADCCTYQQFIAKYGDDPRFTNEERNIMALQGLF